MYFGISFLFLPKYAVVPKKFVTIKPLMTHTPLDCFLYVLLTNSFAGMVSGFIRKL